MKMKEKIMPNYKDGSIMNLISSIANTYNVKSEYGELRLLKSAELKKYKNVVLILLDGLGLSYLEKYGKKSFLLKNLRGKITSIFPSATTPAIPAFFTGTSCLQHGMTSWHSYVKELGGMVIPLPFKPRIANEFKKDVDIKKVFDLKPFSSKINVKIYFVTFSEIKDSEFNLATKGKAKFLDYNDGNISGFLNQVKKAIKLKGKKYTYAYYHLHDSLCHHVGVKSKKTLNHFKKLDKGIEKFAKSIEKDTIVIITADHGSIDVPSNRKIKLWEHDKLAECLNVPICGDNRYAFCFVNRDYEKQFVNYVKKKLGKYCELYKSKDLVKKGLFGKEKPSKKFLERIGDYTLIMKENYSVHERLEGESKTEFNVGEHGGLAKEEMLVPLIVLNKA